MEFIPPFDSEAEIDEYFQRFNNVDEIRTILHVLDYYHAFKQMNGYPACFAKLIMLFSIIEKLWGREYKPFETWITQKRNWYLVVSKLDRFSSEANRKTKLRLLEKLINDYHKQHGASRTVQEFFVEGLDQNEKINFITKIQFPKKNVKERHPPNMAIASRDSTVNSKVLDITFQYSCFDPNECYFDKHRCYGDLYLKSCRIRRDPEILDKQLRDFIGHVIGKMRNDFVHNARTPAVVRHRKDTTESFLFSTFKDDMVISTLSDVYLNDLLDSKFKQMLEHFLNLREPSHRS
nr:hypothetical protein [Candidatus Njordarchaeum guaymaensis]